MEELKTLSASEINSRRRCLPHRCAVSVLSEMFSKPTCAINAVSSCWDRYSGSVIHQLFVLLHLMIESFIDSIYSSVGYCSPASDMESKSLKVAFVVVIATLFFRAIE